jgi:hypothetical protein
VIKRHEEETGANGDLFPQSRNFFVVRFAMRGEHQVVGLNIGQVSGPNQAGIASNAANAAEHGNVTSR